MRAYILWGYIIQFHSPTVSLCSFPYQSNLPQQAKLFKKLKWIAFFLQNFIDL